MTLRKAYGRGAAGGAAPAGATILTFGPTVEVVCNGTVGLHMVADANTATSFTLNKPSAGDPCNFLLTVQVINGDVDLVLGPDVVLSRGVWTPMEGAINSVAGVWDGQTLRLLVIGPGVPFDETPVIPAAVVSATQFNGTITFRRLTDLIGNVDGKKGIFSCWFKFNRNTDNAGMTFYQDIFNGGFFRMEVGLTSHTIDAIFRDGGGANKAWINFSANPVPIDVDGWQHILFAWDVQGANFALGRLNGLVAPGDPAPVALSDATLKYTADEHRLFGTLTGAQPFNGDIAQFYFNNKETLDIRVPANLRKFIDLHGFPVDMGANGELVTGTSPIIFLNNPAATFHQNLGTGGDFVSIGGAPTTGLSTPTAGGVGGGID